MISAFVIPLRTNFEVSCCVQQMPSRSYIAASERCSDWSVRVASHAFICSPSSLRGVQCNVSADRYAPSYMACVNTKPPAPRWVTPRGQN